MKLLGQVYVFLHHIKGDHQLEFCPMPLNYAPGLEDYFIVRTCLHLVGESIL